MLSEHMTPILQRNADIALNLYSKFMGLKCKIYYVQGVGHYSGSNDDLEYNEVHDDEMDLLIPDLFTLCRTAIVGVMDNLFQNEFKLFLRRDQYLPELSKIVFFSDKVGTLQYIVQESDSQHTPDGILYKEMTITPYSNLSNNDPDINQKLETSAEADRLEFEEHGAVDPDPIAESVIDATKAKFSYNPVKGK